MCCVVCCLAQPTHTTSLRVLKCRSHTTTHTTLTRIQLNFAKQHHFAFFGSESSETLLSLIAKHCTPSLTSDSIPPITVVCLEHVYATYRAFNNGLKEKNLKYDNKVSSLGTDTSRGVSMSESCPLDALIVVYRN